MIHKAFGGRVVFHTHNTSVRRQLEMRRLTNELEEYRLTLAPELQEMLTMLPYALSLTDEIEFAFQGDENSQFEDLRRLWQDDLPILDKAALWLDLDNKIYEAWLTALSATTSLYLDPNLAPEELLNPQQREELKDPDSPLAKPA